ncbi:hypothetical protein K9K77_00890, partial [Candidatus Babeliales bacterium]|nr:hypothetical protein [Candidatus Babeliales bacterium]
TFASSAKLTLQAGAKLIFTKGSVLGFTGTVLTSGSNSGSSVMNTLQMVDGTGEIKLKEATLTSATMVSFYQGTVSVDKYSKLINIGHFTPGGIIREGKEFEGDVDINAQIPNTDVTCTADMNMSRSCTFKSLPNFKSDTTVPRICQMKSRTLCDEYFDIENASSIPSANSPTGGSAFAKQVDAIDDSGSPLRAQHVMCHKGNGTTDPGVIRIDCFDPATQNLVKGTELTLTGAAGTVADCQWRKGVTNDNVPIDDKTATRHYVATCVAAPSVNDNGTSTYVNIYKCDIDQAYANANENALAANIINDSNGDGLSLVTNGSLSLPAGQAVKAMAWHPKGKYLTVVVQLAGPTYEVRMYPVKKNGEINTASVITATFTGSAISAPSTAKRPLRWTPKGKILMYAGQNCLESFIFDGKTLKRGSTLTTGLEAASGQTNNICIEPHPFDDICIVGQTVGAATAQKGLRQISYNSKGVLIDTTKTNPDALAVLGAAVIINDLSYHKTGTIISCATSDGVKMVPCDTNKKQFYKAGAIGADSDVTLLNKDSNVTTAHFAAGGTKLIRNSVDGANNAPKIHTLPTNTKGSIARINMELEGDTCHFGTIECSEDSTINLNGGSLDLTPVTVYSIKSGKTLTIQGGTIHGLSGDILNVTDDSTTTHVKKAFNFDFEDDTAAVSFKDCTLDLDSDIAFCCGTVNIEGQVIVTGGHSLVVPKEGTAFVHIASGAQVIANSGDASSVDIDSSKTDNLDALSVAATTDTDLATLQEMNKDDLSIATIGGKNKLKASSKYDSSGVAISNVLEGGTAANPAIIPLAAGSETEWGGPSVTVLNGEIRFDGPTGENDAPAEITISDHQSFMLAENAVIRCTGKVNFNVQSGACLDLGANALIECGSSATKDIDKVNVIINGGELKTNSATAHLNVAAYGKGTFTAINGATCDHQSGGGVVFGGKGSRVSYTDGDGVTVASQTAAGTVDSSLTLLKIDSTFELNGPEEASIVEPIFDIYDNAEGVSVTTNIGNFKVTGQATVSDTTSGDPYLINPEGAAQKVASDTTQNVSQRLGGTEFLNTMPSGQKQGVMNDGAVAALPSNTTTAVLRAGFTYSDGTSTPEYIESRNNKQEVYYSISNGDGTTTTSATPPARS